MDLSIQSCYEILGVYRSFSKKEISAKYHQLARKWHPDFFEASDLLSKESAEKKMKELNSFQQRDIDSSKNILLTILFAAVLALIIMYYVLPFELIIIPAGISVMMLIVWFSSQVSGRIANGIAAILFK